MGWIIEYTLGVGIVLYHTMLLALEERRRERGDRALAVGFLPVV